MEFTFYGKGAIFTWKEFGKITELKMEHLLDATPPPSSNRIRYKYFGDVKKIRNCDVWGYETIPLMEDLYANKVGDSFPRIYNWEDKGHTIFFKQVGIDVFGNNKLQSIDMKVDRMANEVRLIDMRVDCMTNEFREFRLDTMQAFRLMQEAFKFMRNVYPLIDKKICNVNKYFFNIVLNEGCWLNKKGIHTGHMAKIRNIVTMYIASSWVRDIRG
ncbi:hypothetical protein FNV43_RR09733 [Rhamnella rubrinervis]|uniref:Uncharacterized protein n=1 Tax=Rhamnella rubrinervis TaxID=2594499 RepID=A0A8K0HBT6_9ROSA|nr:hypothetical protein FNV43_RR09733 [Rhamnella rubrinervis]